MKSIFLAFVFVFVGTPLVFGEEMATWSTILTKPATITVSDATTTNTITVGDWMGESYIQDPELLIEFTPPSSKFEGDILWSEGIVLHECVKFSPYTKECVTNLNWQFGLKKDGTVVWREVRGD